MRVELFGFILLAGGVTTLAAWAQEPTLTHRPKTVQVKGGARIEVEAGELQVPESRRRPDARQITLPYYRLKSTSSQPAAPIFLLAGGPGSSWLDQLENEENFREVAFYRTIADVVLFDQRGGGHSLPAMDCPQTMQLPADQPFDLQVLRTSIRELLAQCRDHWQKVGVDLAAYNTVENAADVDDLRRAMGYDKVTLVGGSYGSHLALQVMRLYPKRVDRVVLHGVEGTDNTWDSPAGALATLARIAETAERSPTLSGRIPKDGLLKTLARVIERLESAPQPVTAIDKEGSGPVVVNADLVRWIARHRAGRRSKPHEWPEMILAMDRGDYSLPVRAARGLRNLRLQDPMHYSMDCASGISDARRADYRDDPATALLGDINFEYQALCDVWPQEDLGADFRANVVSDIPTVIIHGTWDTSTPIDNAHEAVASLRNGQLLEVVEGTHGALYNLYEHWPPMHGLMGDFLSGKRVDFPDSVALPAVVFPSTVAR